MKFETKCLHEGYHPENGQPRVLPICQSTTFKYDSTEHVGDLFDLKSEGHFYTRLSNPTVSAVENKISALEGGVGALCTSSGQAATSIALLNILKSGDHILSSASIYGGSFNLFNVTLRKLGIEVTFVDPDSSMEEIESNVRDNTKVVFAETLSNPTMAVLDIEKFAKIAGKYNIPFIVDNTFATPYLLRPIDYGADIVTHSTSKYLDGHAVQLGGVIVDGGKYDWANGKFEEFIVPDDSYHGIVYSEAFKNEAYIKKARVQIMRDYGMNMTPMAAFLLNLGLETLPVRMERHCSNALAAAKFLKSSNKIESISYPALEDDKYYGLFKKYLSKGASGVVAFVVKGGRENAVKFMDSLKLASNVVHVADIRTCVLHPASSTHRQMTDEQLKTAGIEPGLIRLSVGLENIDDILEDLKLGLESIL